MFKKKNPVPNVIIEPSPDIPPEPKIEPELSPVEKLKRQLEEAIALEEKKKQEEENKRKAETKTEFRQSSVGDSSFPMDLALHEAMVQNINLIGQLKSMNDIILWLKFFMVFIGLMVVLVLLRYFGVF